MTDQNPNSRSSPGQPPEAVAGHPPEVVVLRTGGPMSSRRIEPTSAVATLAPGTPEELVQRLVDRLRHAGVDASQLDLGDGVLMLPGVTAVGATRLLAGEPAVERVYIPDTRYRLVRREIFPGGTIVDVAGVKFGGPEFVVIAGPCAVESPEQVLAVAEGVARAGAAVMRGGAFKPRTSPYDFQGLGRQGVEALVGARTATGLPFITEVMRHDLVEEMAPLVDGFQVGARNMQNFDLLRALAEAGRPVLLKRNPGATIEEWLLAAEYLLAGGNDQVILCERGIRTFSVDTRYTLDLASVALAKRETHLPVIVDPSHATGDASLIAPMAKAALGAGADGVMVEVHYDPAVALSDGFQALTPAELTSLVADLAALAPQLGRALAGAPTPARAPETAVPRAVSS
ncbi:MAG: 3-deoxy-7-phosphoheptulonate synthase [Anaerolineae bacterium]